MPTRVKCTRVVRVDGAEGMTPESDSTGPLMPTPDGTAAIAGKFPPPAWLRNTSFDSLLIYGCASLAIGTGFLAVGRPELFPLVLMLNFFLLGYHHVVATYTRIAFDSESFRQHRSLVVWLPPIVLIGVVATVQMFGAWAVGTTYFYWQWFHYTRQSYGIEQMYWRKAGGGSRRDRASWGIIYALPLWGILLRCNQQQPLFLGMEILYLPVTSWVLVGMGSVASTFMAVWAFQRILELRRGELRVAHSLYVLSHAAIFLIGYGIIQNIDHGWLVLNVWHNAQYILIVWFYNQNRFKGGVDPQHRFLSTISQPDRVVIYFAFCVSITIIIFRAMEELGEFLSFTGLPVIVILYMAVNFHHYVVDGVIWKLRKPRVREQLGLPSSR